MRRLILLLALAGPLLAADLGAQGMRRRERREAAQNPAARQDLELRLRRGLWRVAKQRIGFTDEQMSKLAESSRTFDERRRTLVRQERAERLALRSEIVAGSSANQTRIAGALDRMMQLQRERVDLQIDEQRAFSTFMTPLQRAKYGALQEQLRRRVENLQRQRAESLATPDAVEVP